MTSASTPAVPHDAGRPSTFDQIVGNQSVVRRTTNMLANNRLPKLLFLTGPTGAGKTTFARIIARSFLCDNRQPGEFEPCGTCKTCRRTLNDTTGNFGDYNEYDANAIRDQDIEDFKLDFLHPTEVHFIDELQDLDPRHLKRLRKLIEGVTATVILTTSHPDEIEDAFRNRLKSYEYEMTRPTVDEVTEYLHNQLTKLGISYDSPEQLIRVAEALDCEMRPIAEFPRRVTAETGLALTDDYLDDIFGAEFHGPAPALRRQRRAI